MTALLVAAAVYLAWHVVQSRSDIVAFFADSPPRTILADLSHLSIPDTVYDGRAVRLSGIDADVWAVARLAPTDCQRALGEAQSRGFKPVPWRENSISAPLGQGVPLPAKGWYWAEDTRRDSIPPPGKRHAWLSWIDADNCRVFASYNSGG